MISDRRLLFLLAALFLVLGAANLVDGWRDDRPFRLMLGMVMIAVAACHFRQVVRRGTSGA